MPPELSRLHGHRIDDGDEQVIAARLTKDSSQAAMHGVAVHAMLEEIREMRWDLPVSVSAVGLAVLARIAAALE